MIFDFYFVILQLDTCTVVFFALVLTYCITHIEFDKYYYKTFILIPPHLSDRRDSALLYKYNPCVT